MIYSVSVISRCGSKGFSGVVSWWASNASNMAVRIETLEEAVQRFGALNIFNINQGAQFTSQMISGVLEDQGNPPSMYGKGRWLENRVGERLCRSIKYEDVILRAYDTATELSEGLVGTLTSITAKRRHSALGRCTPNAIPFKQASRQMAACIQRMISLMVPSKCQILFLNVVQAKTIERARKNFDKSSFEVNVATSL